jgi:hypothetical protein
MIRSLEDLLGTHDRDPGCDAAFDVLDQYVEAVRRGEDVSVRFAGLIAHLKLCVACREDTASLMAALDDIEGPSPR